MLAVAHDARLGQRSNPKDPESLTHRQVHEQFRDAARAKHRIDQDAEAALEEPPYPEWIQPLRDAHRLLLGRSGVGPDGLAPLSMETLTHARTLYGLHFEPHEMDLLFTLDAIARHPERVRLAAPERKAVADAAPAVLRRGRDVWANYQARQQARREAAQ